MRVDRILRGCESLLESCVTLITVPMLRCDEGGADAIIADISYFCHRDVKCYYF